MMKANKREMIVCLSQAYRGIYLCPCGNREKYYGKLWDNVSKDIFSAICFNYDWINEKTLVNIHDLRTDKREKSCQLISKESLKEIIRDGYYAVPTHIYYEFGAIDTDGFNHTTTINANTTDHTEVMKMFDNWLRESGMEPSEITVWHILSSCEDEDTYNEIDDSKIGINNVDDE